MFQLAAGDEWWIALLRTNVLPPAANYLLSLESVRNFIFPLISQTGINYRHSSLSRHAGDEDFKVKAGDRMPYIVLDGASVYDRLREPKFHILAFSNEQGKSGAANTEFEQYADFHRFQLTREVKGVFGTDQPFVVLLRPDNYIGFIASDSSSGTMAQSAGLLDHWLRRAE